jgi:tryptophan-rich sensory protein
MRCEVSGCTGREAVVVTAMNSKRWLPLGLFLGLALAAAGLGALATATSVDTWYVTLRKPQWTPPDWIFAPVWAVLYLLMAVATWRAWRTGDALVARRTVSLYSAQLTLNVLWSILFFRMRHPAAALVEIVVLWTVLVIILFRYWRIDRLAAVLWMPYVAWITFAAALNGAIWSLNR